MARFDLCKYSGVFGEPRTGIHGVRIPVLDVAFNDVLGTIIFSYILYAFLGEKYNFFYILLFLLILSVPVHLLFCVKTKITSFF